MSSLLEYLGNEEAAAGVCDVVLEHLGLGKLPPELSNCLTMEYLSLAHNSLYQSTDNDFDFLAQCGQALHTLVLSNNQFGGTLKLPPQHHCLGSLLSLDLSNNHIQSIGVVPLRNICPMLVYIDVSHNNLSGIEFAEGLQFLETLDVAQNDLCGVVQVANFEYLATLDLSFNKITQVVFQEVAALKSVSLQHNDIQVCKGVEGCPLLEEFYSSHNRLEQIPQGMEFCIRLQHVDFGENKLQGVGMVYASWSALMDANFLGNKLKRIPEPLQALSWKQLQHCNISHNEITDEDSDVLLATDVDESSEGTSVIPLSLQHFDGSYNQFCRVPMLLKCCNELRHLDLRNNQITSLPPYWEDTWKHMEVFLISCNQLKECPRDFSNWNALTEFDVGSNELEHAPATFPASLQSLYLSNNIIPSEEVQEVVRTFQRADRVLKDCVVEPQREAQKRSKRWKALNSAHSSLSMMLERLKQQQQEVVVPASKGASVH
eukprot:PhF_6_TR13179/c0_g1_i2/m.20789/K19613/SHOC2, SUR8; leucine-rich repeat protein SHOC2